MCYLLTLANLAGKHAAVPTWWDGCVLDIWWGYNMWLGLGRDMGLCNLEAEVKPPSRSLRITTQRAGLRFSLTQRCGGRPPSSDGSSQAAVTGSLGLEMFFFGRTVAAKVSTRALSMTGFYECKPNTRSHS